MGTDGGACCFPDGHCVLKHLPCACESTGGDFQGEQTVCLPSPCSSPPGACCFLDQTCAVLAPSECAQQQGEWRGEPAECDPNPCLTPVEPATWGRIKARYR